MRPLFRHIAVGVLASTLAACSSSNDDSGSDPTLDDGTPVAGTDEGTISNGVPVPPVAGTPGVDVTDPVVVGPLDPLNDPTDTGTGTVDPGTGTAAPGMGTGTTDPGTGTGTADPDTGTGTTDPDTGTGTTDPGTGTGTTDPDTGAGTTDPDTGTGTTDPDTGTGTTDPDTGTGTTDPDTGTGTTDPDTGTGTTDPDTGTGTTDPDTGTGTTDPDTGTGTTDPDTGTGTTDPDTGTGTTDPDTGTGTTDPDTGTGTTDPDTGTGTTDPAPGTGTGTTDPDVTFSDGEQTSCEERILGRYVRTLSEACSLGGPSFTDADRADDAPSAPTGLTALLVAEDWVQIDWIPSRDNGAVVAYDIFRDGQLAATVDDDVTKRIAAQRYWRTTTYIDCDFTRFFCEAAERGIGRPQPGTTHEYTVVAIDDLGNRSAPSAPLAVTMNTVEMGAAPPDPDSEGYTLAFGDEFDGTSLDRDKWRTSLSYDQFRDDGSVVNGEQQFFVDTRGSNSGFPYDPFKFDGDGTLKIQAVRTADVDLGDRLAEARGQPYLSGVISSRDKFKEGVRYGYVEMRAKLPSGNGLLSTFFLFQRSANQYEIDILEYLGREPDGATQNYHYRDGFRYDDNGIRNSSGDSVDGGYSGVAHASPTMTLDTGVDLSGEFRTYSVLWEPKLVIWYVDGQEVRRLTGPRVSDVSMDIVAQFVIGSPNFAGDPSAVDFPVSYEIDYIRAWKK